MSSEKISKKTTKSPKKATKQLPLPSTVDFESLALDLSGLFPSPLPLVSEVNPLLPLVPPMDILSPVLGSETHQLVYDTLVDTSRILPGKQEDYAAVLLQMGIVRPSDVIYLPTLVDEFAALLLCLNGIGRIKLREAVSSLSPPSLKRKQPHEV